jgi:DNA-binding MarR family transcriptional regulator
VALGELADRLHCVRSNVTALVDRLEADGLVQRTADPRDRRAMRAALTPLGAERHRAGTEAVGVLEHDLAAQLTAAERETLLRALAALAV